MKKTTFKSIFAAAFIAGLAAIGTMAMPTSVIHIRAAGTPVRHELPDCDHEYEGKMYEEVYDYIEDTFEKDFAEADVGVPVAVVIDEDQSNPNDIVIKGDFQYYNFNLNGDTLETDSFGSQPGAIHLRKEKDGDYEVIKMEKVEDGSEFDSTAKKIFGDKYDAFLESQSNNTGDSFRNQILANYVEENGLAIRKVKDYGQDAVTLPEANMEDFSSLVNNK